MNLNFDEVEVGDYVKCQTVNKKGDRNLDGQILFGIITEKNTKYRQIKLESGWCCHEKDLLLEHRPADKEQEKK